MTARMRNTRLRELAGENRAMADLVFGPLNCITA
jgi:hypothetical protein